MAGRDRDQRPVPPAAATADPAAMNQIVVGADGFGHSLPAVEWAAEEAVRRDTPLRIVHAVAPWLFDLPVGPRAGAVRHWLLDGGEDVLDGADEVARARAPRVRVSAGMVPGGPARALITEAEHAAMVVVGGHGALTGLLLGSVALQVAVRAPCPVVVVRELEPALHREVVVGVDGSPGSPGTVGFAYEEAALRHARLRAVKYPEVDAVHQLGRGRPARALTSASAGADLLVVGTPGGGGFTGLVLGWIAQAVLRNVRCPLAVVPSGGR
jgi:nucleotide-binding universal stress UspA family protein